MKIVINFTSKCCS